MEDHATPSLSLDVADNIAEYVADSRSEQRKNDNDNNRNQNKNQRVLNKTLTTFLRCEQHNRASFLSNF